MAFVYLLAEENDLDMTKIGVTTAKKIETRMKKLQTGNGNKIVLLNHFETDDAFKIEKMLHAHFQNDRQEGEWFLLNQEQRNSFITKCNEYQELLNDLKDNPFIFKKK